MAGSLFDSRFFLKLKAGSVFGKTPKPGHLIQSCVGQVFNLPKLYAKNVRLNTQTRALSLTYK
jgi:hypothetical protein